METLLQTHRNRSSADQSEAGMTFVPIRSVEDNTRSVKPLPVNNRRPHGLQQKTQERPPESNSYALRERG